MPSWSSSGMYRGDQSTGGLLRIQVCTSSSRHSLSPPPNPPTHQTRILQSRKTGEMAKRRGKGREWKRMGGNGGGGGMGHGMAHRMGVMEGCGRMWLRKMGQKWGKNERKMGEKWDKIPIFHSPIFPIFPEVKDLPLSSLGKNQLRTLTDAKMGFFATHRHSPPRQLLAAGIPCVHRGAQLKILLLPDRIDDTH